MKRLAFFFLLTSVLLLFIRAQGTQPDLTNLEDSLSHYVWTISLVAVAVGSGVTLWNLTLEKWWRNKTKTK